MYILLYRIAGGIKAPEWQIVRRLVDLLAGGDQEGPRPRGSHHDLDQGDLSVELCGSC